MIATDRLQKKLGGWCNSNYLQHCKTDRRTWGCTYIGIMHTYIHRSPAEKALDLLFGYGHNVEPNNYFANKTLIILVTNYRLFSQTFLGKVPSPFAYDSTCCFIILAESIS